MKRQGQYFQDGKIIDYSNGGTETIVAGEVVSLVSRVGFAAVDIPPGATGGVVVEGAFCDVPAESTVAFVVGDAVYWDATADVLTKTVTDNVPAGWVLVPKAQTGTTAVIKLLG